MISVADAILADVLEQFPIDRRRVYLTGVSSGGMGAWEYVMRWPERFAAVAPLAGARHNAASLRAVGGHVKLTEVDTVSHDCWTAAFGEHQLLNWMLTQRKGEPSSWTFDLGSGESAIRLVAGRCRSWSGREWYWY